MTPTLREAPTSSGGKATSALERALWGSRLLVIAAVVATVLLAVAALLLATADAVSLPGLLAGYADPALAGDARDALRTAIVTTIVKALDGYLIAALLLVVAFGLYELFISRIDPAEGTDAARRLLQVRDLEDLKQRVAKLVVLVLVVEFFQQALKLQVADALELLWLGLGILVVSAALWLSGQHAKPSSGGG